MCGDLVFRFSETLDELERVARQALLGWPVMIGEDLSGLEPALLTAEWTHRYHEVLQRMTQEPSPEWLERRRRISTLGVPIRWDAPEKVADCGPANVYPARHIARWDPQAVLRLVKSHRAVIVAYTEAQEHAALLLRGRAHGATVLEADGVARGLRIALENLAAGFGITEEP
jgi:hypothetical protein